MNPIKEFLHSQHAKVFLYLVNYTGRFCRKVLEVLELLLCVPYESSPMVMGYCELLYEDISN